jgi:hypothetical protein
MALISLGRNVAVAARADEVPTATNASADSVREEANKKLEEARKSILDALTPWIPGDFIVAYGILLTAWTQLRASFLWMLVIAAACAVGFVIGGAFAETGFARPANKSGKVASRLMARTLIGFLVAVYASVAIPTSGWYDFQWFVDNELASVVTASVLVTVAVLFLKGIQRRWNLTST